MAGYVIVSDFSRSALVALLFCCCAGIGKMSAEVLRVVSYNVENLFYPERDSVNTDSLFTPEGERRWSFRRYSRKVENIARVLTTIGEWDGVDVAGLQEVESEECVQRLCHVLRRGEYGWAHYDSPDRRGIDVALIYKKARIDTLATKAIRVDLGEQTTRDILYVKSKIKGRKSGTEDREQKAEKDILHFFVCHLPSQLGGTAETAWKREQAKRVLQAAVDSVLAVEPDARIVVMGDMNSSPADDLQGLRNRMTELAKNGAGTHKWQGRLSCLDQFYTSPALDSISDVRIYDAEWIQEPDEKFLGLRPQRTFVGFRYQEGFSDHLPIVLVIGNW